VALLLITGLRVWSAWHNSQQLKQAQAAAEKTSKTPSLLDPAHRKHLFSIYQWGVRGLYVGTLSLKYVIIDHNGYQTAYFTSDELSAADPSCSIASSAGGMVDKYAENERFDFDGITETVEKYLASRANIDYSHVGKFYYIISKGKITCDASSTSKKLQADTFTDVESITKSFVTYCSIQVCG